MVRHLVVPLLLAVLLVPDWAVAFGPPCQPVPQPCQPYYGGGYVVPSGPVVYGPAVPGCAPAMGTIEPSSA